MTKVHAFLFKALSAALLLQLLGGCSQPPAKVTNFAPQGAEPDPVNDPASGDENGLTQEASPSPAPPSPLSPSPAAAPMPIVMSAGPAPAAMPAPASAPVTAMPLTECTNHASLGRIYQWIATTEGTMIPSSGSIVVSESGKNIARVKFLGTDWHVVPTWLKNTFESEADLSGSKSFTITYSAAGDIYVQMRPSFAWDGGAKYVVKLPATGGATKSLTIPLEAASWTTLAALGDPPYPFAMAVKQVRGFVYISKVPGDFVVSAFAIDGFTPPCP